MSKVSIVYIGPKESKRDTTAGTRQVFRRMIPTLVEEAAAANLLRFDQVFVEESALDSVKAKMKAKQEAEEEAAKLALLEAEKEQEELDHTVLVGGESFDLNKMNTTKIATMLAGADIELEPKGAQESAADYKLRVRDALRAMSQE
jgi:hypothetical protein